MPAHTPSPEIAALQKKIGALDAARKRARQEGNRPEVKRISAQIHDLRKQITQARRADKGGRGGGDKEARQERRAVRTGRPGPRGEIRNDPYDTMEITCENAAAVFTHYRDLARTTKRPGMALRAHWHRRAGQARKIMRLCDKHGMANVKALRAKKKELRQQAKHQRGRADKAHAAGRHNEAGEAARLADRYDEQIKVLDAAEQLPPDDIDVLPPSPGDRPRGVRGARPGRPGMPPPAGGRAGSGESDEDGSSVSASAKLDESGLEASADLDLPWYRRYAIPLALAALVGVGAFAMRKGGGGAAFLSGPSPARGRPLKVSRMVFHAKRPHVADKTK